MARRWADPSAFRADPTATPSARPSWRQSVALVAVLVVVAGVVAAVSYLVRPDRARSFDLLHGSVLIGDQFGPVSVDLGSGKGTLQIRGADDLAGVRTPGDLQLVGLDGGTLLLNRSNGTFNMVDSTGFVVKRNGGVPIAGGGGDSTATGVAAGQLAYIERSSSAGTDVVLASPATVSSAAANPRAKVRPRAVYASADVGVTAEGGSTSANGDFWGLFTRKSGGATVIRRLTLPARSSTGVTLRASDHGTVDALSAIESTTARADGTGGDVVGVASPGRIRLIGADLHATTVTYRAPAGLDTIVSTTSAQGRLSWLLHGSEGWSVLSVAPDGSGRVGPVALGTVPTDARLAPPAQSLGALYTMLRSGSAGTVYRIGFDGKVTAVVAAYPQKTGPDGRSLESASFDDGYLVARNSRVVVDSPGHYLALTVFTDGSHAPRVIEKTDLTSVNAANGADALTRGAAGDKPATKPAPGKQVKQNVAPQINNKINCKQVNQKPHVPRIASANPSARSVGLAWVYPILSTQDCNPSTYVVSVKLISNDAPPAPGSVTLQGHTDTVIGGLFPSTQYQFTVTAYINGQGTTSQPVLVSTGKEGPAAPTGLSVSADSAGNWDLSWSGCGSVARSCVPTDSWTIRPSFCDNRGLSASPPSVSAPADPTSVRQPAAVYKGGGSLLGRSLQFQIQGTGADGTAGDVSATTACVQSWAPPVQSAIHLAASVPPQTASASDTSRTTASLSFDGSEQTALGGVGATVRFQLLQGGSVVTSSTAGSATTATLSGIRPGQTYQVQAVVTPPGHPGQAVTIGPVNVDQASAAWPQLGVGIDSVHNNGALSADVTFHVTGISSSQAAGEKFDVGYQFQCGNASPGATTVSAVDPSAPITFSVNRLTYRGSCSVSLTRVAETTNGVFGGTPAPRLGGPAPVTIDDPTLTGVSSSDFSVTWAGDSNGSSAHITYSGGNPVLGLLASWTVSVVGPGNDSACTFGYSGHGSLDDVPISQACVDKYKGSGAGWTTTVSVSSLGSQGQGPFTITNIDAAGTNAPGTAPSWVPPVCDVSSLAATWSGTAAAPSVDVSATASKITDCSGWTYTIKGPQTAACGSSSAGAPPQTIGVATATCTDAPAATGWSVVVGYKDTAGATQSTTVDVTGDPPS